MELCSTCAGQPTPCKLVFKYIVLYRSVQTTKICIGIVTIKRNATIFILLELINTIKAETRYLI